MIDEDVLRGDVSIPGLADPQAKIIFLTVALAKGFFVEQPHGMAPCGAHKKTETNTRRHIARTAGVAGGRKAIQAACVLLHFDRVIPIHLRIAENRRVVAERRDRRDTRIARRVDEHPIDPIAGHLRVRVEEDDRNIRMDAQGFIDGRNEPQIALVSVEPKQPFCRQNLQVS